MSRAKSVLSRKNSDGGGMVWTSFSDLFTTVAIVFLVMFAVMLIKQSVTMNTAVQAKKTLQDFVEGNVSEEVKKRVAERKETMQQNLLTLESYKVKAQNLTQQIASLNQDVSKHWTLVEDLAQAERENAVTIEKLNEKIETQKDTVASAQKAKETFSYELNSRDQLIQDLESKISEQAEQIKKLTSVNNQAEDRKEELSDTIAEMQKSITTKDQEINKLQDNINQRDEEINKNNIQSLALKKRIELLEQDLEAAAQSQSGQSETIANLQSQLADSNEINESLQKSLNDSKSYNEALGKELKNNRAQIAQKGQQLESLGGQVKQLSDALNQANQEKSSLASSLENQKSVVSQVTTGTYETSLREKLSERLIGRFNQAGLEVTLNKATGTLVFDSDHLYLFENDSSKLAVPLKEQLKVAIPIFAQELFEDPELSKHIAEVNIIGHASPRWESQAVIPEETSTQAYRANMRLSANRALSVTDFIFSHAIGRYKYREELGKIIKPSGLSYSQPIPLSEERKLDSGAVGCGRFDCMRSRRVEISFALKGPVYQNFTNYAH